MNKQNFISVTLLVSALAFNPLVAEELNTHVISSQIERNTVSSGMASILHQRGLDEDAAKIISEDLVKGKDELFALMIDNLINNCEHLGRNEILEYLSRAALHRQDVYFDSYAQLVNMVSTIKQKSLDEKTLKRLSVIAKQNALMLG